MWNLIFKLLEVGVDRYTEYKVRTTNDATEIAKIRADAEKTKDQVRGMVLGQGALWFQLFFIIPLSLWFSAVVIYSLLWCQDCIYPQTWSIAALPSPLNEWAGWIIGFLFLAQVSRK